MEQKESDSRAEYRQFLESENSEYEYGHNVEYKSKEEWN